MHPTTSTSTSAAAGPGGTGGGPRRPARSVRAAQARVDRARATLHTRYADAVSERERLAAAGDYVRSLAAAAAESGGPTAAAADQVLAGLVRELLRGGEALADHLTTPTPSRSAPSRSAPSRSAPSRSARSRSRRAW